MSMKLSRTGIDQEDRERKESFRSTLPSRLLNSPLVDFILLHMLTTMQNYCLERDLGTCSCHKVQQALTTSLSDDLFGCEVRAPSVVISAKLLAWLLCAD